MYYTNDLNAISDIVNYINNSEEKEYCVDKCKDYFNALECVVSLYSEYAEKNNLFCDLDRFRMRDGELSINAKFSETFLQIFEKENNFDSLIDSKMFKELIFFKPHIMNDKVLENKRYNPDNISDELREQATKIHKDLISSYERKSRKYLIINLCKLLYMVRSNLSHYGKTPFGPDQNKSKEYVC